VSLLVYTDLLHTLLDEARRGYPEEICGALLGHSTDANARVVVLALPIENQRTTERTTRYLIGPDDYRAIDAEARARRLDVVGFYHSHPDHAAEPSAFDREHAWPWYAYVIVPVYDGHPRTPRAWRLADDRSHFDELEIVQHAVDPTPAKEAS
jgi:proteasome lid subunit RPN8/RPN11